jgi:hypothetical protein
MSQHFGPVRQVGYIVADVRRAIEDFMTTMGIGPFFTMPEYPVANYEFRGQRSEPVVSVAISYSGPLQIELIQPLGDTPSLYRELSLARLPGPHYVTYWVLELASSVRDAIARGATVVQSGGIEGAGRFAYLHAPSGTLFELLETNEMIEAWFGGMQSAAASWDGSEPIRSAMP